MHNYESSNIRNNQDNVPAWINHDTYNEVRNKLGKNAIDKFITSMKKGIVGAEGENGIKILKNAKIGNKSYAYEIKVKGKFGDWRIYGNYDEESGHIIFDLFGKGLH